MSEARLSGITAAITQVAANKLKIKIDAKCDLGSSHCYRTNHCQRNTYCRLVPIVTPLDRPSKYLGRNLHAERAMDLYDQQP